MAVVDVFRSYPRPGASWRRWTVWIDGDVAGKLGGAGVLEFQCADREAHQLYLERGSKQRTNVMTLRPTDGQHIFVYATTASDEGDELVLKMVSDAEQLPKSCIPNYSPSGEKQEYEIGLRHAYLGTAVIMAVSIGMLMACIGIVIDIAVGGRVALVLPALLLAAFGGWLAVKMRIAVLLLRNQRNWPLPEWRVDRKGDENQEWKRLSQPA